ncbi:MAG: hypothetical protein LQ338_001982 [Usnochroma carphineum]|nr:MAG: hypothetical protein LQ338_001982 [Usnochroma carphineum]
MSSRASTPPPVTAFLAEATHTSTWAHMIKYPTTTHNLSSNMRLPNPEAGHRGRPGAEENVPNRFELFLLGDGEKKVTEETDTRIPSTSVFTFNKEDHTLGNMLRARLLQSPQVLFSGYKVPHPLFSSFILRVQTDGTVTPRQALIQACKDLVTDLGLLSREFTKEWELLYDPVIALKKINIISRTIKVPLRRFYEPAADNMPGPSNTLLIEGSFEELADELSHYLDEVKRKQGDTNTAIQTEITPLLEQNQKDEVLKKLVTGSAALNSAPEKEFIAAYNLLIHLVRQSPNTNIYLPRICQNLSNPITSSPANGPGLALSVLTTIFNILPQDNDVRYHVFLAILRVIRSSSSFELLRPQLKNIDTWIAQWETDEEDQRKLYLTIAEVAEEASEEEQSYLYLLRALRTIPVEEASSPEARSLSIRALKSALSYPIHFDFQDLTSLDSIQALRKSDPVLFELLDIFNAQVLDDYNDFKDEHDSFISTQSLSDDVLTRKMRLLTLASLAASTQSRSLPYQHISRALQIPSEDTEIWVIDTIRAGLVEGKLSQLNQTFLVHRSTYRVFGEKQWTEVQGRLDTWRASLEGVLGVVRAEREKVQREKERELREVEGKVNGAGMGRGGRREVDVGALVD